MKLTQFTAAIDNRDMKNTPPDKGGAGGYFPIGKQGFSTPVINFLKSSCQFGKLYSLYVDNVNCHL